MVRVDIRRIKKTDDPKMAAVIRRVMPEFGATQQGFALHDAEVDALSEAYSREGTAYFVCEYNGAIVGGCGIGPLLAGDPDTCELKKMYFLAEGRSKGFGRQMLQACIHSAREMGYAYCYLETFHTMQDAMRLYEKNGFEKIDGPLGNTGHFACDTFYRLKL